ncbi:MAG: hypothetical protein CO186_12965 [Zetaproteobacteria bacterium CG_4_9_14_3_um_filter_49_83]|nr:MAG: hypothetical protein AUJ56_03125 [Zetaproteobacteria bacterium CG1_02_49_23]PIQ33174.1 MAG: hypothetical protein COW62_06150 [Zetaproteobacteria bacterium CG17_big_fil_post_rev_8_21_14_2_50_50_13]PIV29376.1 MAG: hypothetical protein COS35_12490 [Zetaproteobacteria bacterium CG02_land_8_20_14_3_00_50_9]PIY54810.1 MAG: hypothetical protein COZ00_12880 [Zetaproteobacteria bacterium CG_4_10_14_0_8_um_filter_49_80]PJA33661.1 MAG: hypothetical protein CO186_12965 [Zetaproteobacteria bacterium
MHFEILVEDQSGKKTLDILVPKIIGDEHTFNIHPYKGIGRIPKGLSTDGDVSKRILLDQLPRLLRGYGNTFAKYPADYPTAVILVCDLDNKCLKSFRQELFNILNACNPKPETRFCIAIEEGEAWFLGDIPAVKAAYPKAKESVLNAYENDSICGTWECLADAVYSGGYTALSDKGWQGVGAEKSQCAEKISPHMDVLNNESPSFTYFRQKLLELSGSIDSGVG